MLLRFVFYQISDSYNTFKCVQKDDVPVAFYAHISHTFKALSTHEPFIFDVMETNFVNRYDRKNWHLHCPMQWCVRIFGPFTPLVHIMLALKAVMGKWRLYWQKMELQKGQSMQIQKQNMMMLWPQGSCFWLLRREINFKSSVHRQAKARFSAPMGKHHFWDIGLISWLLIGHATIFVEY